MEKQWVQFEEDRFRLAIPISEAVPFAMGWSDLSYQEPHDGLRQLVGLLAIDALEYSEQWRYATMLKVCLAERWPNGGF